MIFSFGFFYNSKECLAVSYSVLSNIDQVSQYEAHVKEGLESGVLRLQEAYHFNVPVKSMDSVVQAINDRDSTQQGKNGGFYGPIIESHSNFVRFLSDSKQL